jgi:hypothetical protein
MHNTGRNSVRVNGRECKIEEKACQENILGDRYKDKIGNYTPMEIGATGGKL